MGSIAVQAAAQAQPVAAPPVEQPAPAPLPAQPAPAPMLVAPVQQRTNTVLPANTELTLSVNDTVTTKGKQWHEGDNFNLTVTHNVMLGNYVVIPKGSRGVGRITWLTNKGAFGKSGKMDIELEYVEVGGRRIPITGTYRQEGEGNTVATVGGVVAAGIFAGFITGKSGVIPRGRELTAHTKDDLPVVFAGPAPTQTVAPITATSSSSQQSNTTTATDVRTAEERKDIAPGVKCLNC